MQYTNVTDRQWDGQTDTRETAKTTYALRHAVKLDRPLEDLSVAATDLHLLSYRTGLTL